MSEREMDGWIYLERRRSLTYANTARLNYIPGESNEYYSEGRKSGFAMFIQKV